MYYVVKRILEIKSWNVCDRATKCELHTHLKDNIKIILNTLRYMSSFYHTVRKNIVSVSFSSFFFFFFRYNKLSARVCARNVYYRCVQASIHLNLIDVYNITEVICARIQYKIVGRYFLLLFFLIAFYVLVGTTRFFIFFN